MWNLRIYVRPWIRWVRWSKWAVEMGESLKIQTSRTHYSENSRVSYKRAITLNLVKSVPAVDCRRPCERIVFAHCMCNHVLHSVRWIWMRTVCRVSAGSPTAWKTILQSIVLSQLPILDKHVYVFGWTGPNGWCDTEIAPNYLLDWL